MASDRWLEAYRANRELTRCPVDLNAYFESEMLAGRRLTVMDVGTCSLPSGRVLVRDPLEYLGDSGERPYMESVEPGEYRAEVSVVLSEGCDEPDRYAAVRLVFNDSRPVSFYEALVGYEDIYHMSEGEYFGFNSETGLACICDETAHAAYCEWLDILYEDEMDIDPGEVLRDQMFKNASANPAHQREVGDWLDWVVPGTKLKAPIVQTGFGDGAYPVYWGYNSDGKICQLVVQFIDIELAYAEDA